MNTYLLHFFHRGWRSPKKITIYPDEELYKTICKAADSSSVSLNTCICDILRESLFVKPKSQVIESEITKEIYEQIKDYVKNAKDGEEFSLMEASATFANTDYIYKYDAKNFRAKIGMSFAKQVNGKDKFNDVKPAFKENGKRKLGKNNTVLYRVVKIDE